MKEESRMGLWERQTERIPGHLWQRYSLTVNQSWINSKVKLSKWRFQGKTRFASCLDLHLEIDIEGRSRTKLYVKRNDFNFSIVNFQFIYNNIPAAPAYGVYLSQLIRYSRVCGSYRDSIDRGFLLTRKLLNQGFLMVKLKSLLRKFYGRHYDLLNVTIIYVSQMTTDTSMFRLS